MRFAVVDPDGELSDVVGDMHDAVTAASRLASRVQVEGGDGREGFGDLGEFGKLPPEQLPEIALKNSGLPRIDIDKVMDMSIEEAHSRLLPFFPKTRTRKSGEIVQVKNYATVTGMVDSLLGQNSKTAKGTPEAPTYVEGLSILPYSMGKQLSGRSLPMRGLGFCVGSSEACRKACLVFSGHNVIDMYNQQIKLSKTEALSLEPYAFARILQVALKKLFSPRDGTGGYERMVRLNVFSDVPWELVFPGIFEIYSSDQFYDYTKVPGRVTPENYDITFSWSGANEDWVYYELERGRRIAVVFMTNDRKAYNKWRKTTDKRSVAMMGLPSTFLGLPVIDGDISDVRPRDPAPGIVGLRWKPHGLGKKHNINLEENTAFVVPVREIDGVLVAAESARQSPIEDHDGEE